MEKIKPMSWARMPAERGYAPRKGTDTVDPKKLCRELSDILVDKIGAIQGIFLETDPTTGGRVFNFVVNPDSMILQNMVAREINGIPVRFTLSENY